MNRWPFITIVILFLTIIGLTTALILQKRKPPYTTPHPIYSNKNSLIPDKPAVKQLSIEDQTEPLLDKPIEIYSFIAPLPKNEKNSAEWLLADYAFDIPANSKLYVLVIEAIDATGYAAPRLSSMEPPPEGNSTLINLHQWKGEDFGWEFFAGLGLLRSPRNGVQRVIYWFSTVGRFKVGVHWDSPWAVKVFELAQRIPDDHLPNDFISPQFIKEWTIAYRDFENKVQDNIRKRQLNELWDDYDRRKKLARELKRRF